MKRNCSIEEISDGKLYGVNDMVKVGCNDCAGCFSCCQGMGQSVILDPFDIFRLTFHLNLTFEGLLAEQKIELNVVDGIILPNLKMAVETEKCGFLNKENRCSIHTFRPGICRLFPLGRYYEDNDFRYFLQVHECKKQNRTKVKVSKWIEVGNEKKNHAFILAWHSYLNEIQKEIENTSDDFKIKEINLLLLNQFYMQAYDKTKDFYEQFEQRMKQNKE